LIFLVPAPVDVYPAVHREKGNSYQLPATMTPGNLVVVRIGAR
jgi:hypothetical protein